MQEKIYTIGHSNHSVVDFIRLLKLHEITAVCDVRSAPYSRLHPQFNREELKRDLKEDGIRYVYLGDELGARSDDPSCYVDDQVQYDLLSQTELFRSGIERVKEGLKSYRIALMCAEKDPMDCHRTILVTRNLVQHGISARHILYDGSIEDETQFEDRLLETAKLKQDDFFHPREERIRDAYVHRGSRIAYKREDRKTA